MLGIVAGIVVLALPTESARALTRLLGLWLVLLGLAEVAVALAWRAALRRADPTGPRDTHRRHRLNPRLSEEEPWSRARNPYHPTPDRAAKAARTTSADRAVEPGHALSAEERAEYERLRRHAGVRHRRLRKAGAAVLLVVTLLLAPLAVVAAWVQETVADTDRYVETVAPLASEPAVQQVVIDRLTNEVVKNVDVKAVTDALTKVLAENGAPATGRGGGRGPRRPAALRGPHRRGAQRHPGHRQRALPAGMGGLEPAGARRGGAHAHR